MFFSKKENKNDNKSNLIKIAALLIHTAKIDEIYTNKEPKRYPRDKDSIKYKFKRNKKSRNNKFN